MYPSHLIGWAWLRSRPDPPVAPEAGSVTIRQGVPADRDAVVRLAALDSAPLPKGRLLIAERDGVIVAAAPVEGGRVVADPFVPTADLVRLLEVRAAQIAAAGQARSAEPVRSPAARTA